MRDEFTEEVYTREEFDEAQQEHEDEVEQLKQEHEDEVEQLKRQLRPLWKSAAGTALHAFAGGMIGVVFLHWNWWLSCILGIWIAWLLD
jgi:hypothetical protein